ncbi:hypothetical protein BDV95DRAFT_582244 [Massariosphaeria phaeospora]|uniref:F-box domain-containing protein n=1 Tax=Massariosphaeria phaeospora TaxID=100035 RepID=A0A7C8I3W3_9PLEO|nr:hypothetical protein BDV95DRAFT_582244 [Massariosphaeria phaeospora]
MRAIPNLPNELLLRIANYVSDDDVRSAHRSLKNLALVSRKFRPIAQEVLFRHVVIVEDGHNYDNMIPLALFVRTLLDRPDLVPLIHGFDVDIRHRSLGHGFFCSQNSEPRCECGWAALRLRCIKTTPRIKQPGPRNYGFLDSPDYLHPTWSQNVLGGEEIALFALALDMLPKLKVLLLSLDSGQGMRAKFPTVADCFGTEDVDLSRIPGLVSLHSLRIHSSVPGKLLSFPELRHLHFRLPSYRDGRIGPRSQLLPTDMALSTTLQRLTIDLDLYEVHRMVSLCLQPKTSAGYFTGLQKRLMALKHLSIRLKLEGGVSPCHNDYNGLAMLLISDTVEHLVIDTFQYIKGNCHRSNLEEHELPEGFARLHPIQPMVSLTHLPRLRSVTAPEQALYGIIKCEFPPSIECIAVIDCITTPNLYARHLAASRSRYPKLNTLRLWLDRHNAYPSNCWKYTLPDKSVAYKSFDLESKMDPGVLTQLEDARIRVDQRNARGRPWRADA